MFWDLYFDSNGSEWLAYLDWRLGNLNRLTCHLLNAHASKHISEPQSNRFFGGVLLQRELVDEFRRHFMYVVLSVAALLILGSYLVVTTLSIWLPPADILVPVKFSLVMIFFLWAVYTFAEAIQSYRRRNWLRLMFSFLSIVLLAGFVSLYDTARTFILNRFVLIDLSFLSVDIKLLATFGLVMAATFMAHSIYHFVWDRVLWASIRSLVTPLGKTQEERKQG